MRREVSLPLGRYSLVMAAFILAAASPVTRKLVELGENHLIDGRNPISFCNVLFVGNIVAFIALLLVYGRQPLVRQFQQLSRQEWIVLIAIAIFSGALIPALYFTALAQTNVNNVILIGQINAPLTLALSVWLLKDRINSPIILGAIFASVGVVLTVVLQPSSDKMMGNSSVIGLGDLLVFLAAILQAISTVVERSRLKQIPLGLVSIVKTGLGTIVFFITAVQLFGWTHFQDAFSLFLWQWMIFYSLVIVVIGQLLWIRGLRNSSAAEVSLVNALMPVVSIVTAFLILGEIPTTAQYIGGTVIIIGIIITQIGIMGQPKAKRKEIDINTGFKGI